MTRKELCQQRLGHWLDGLELPRLDDPGRRLEELALTSLRQFFLLLLVSTPEPAATPLQALESAGGLTREDIYRRHLSLPLKGSPDALASAIDLGPPSGELFALQERLIDGLDEEGRLLMLQLGQLF